MINTIVLTGDGLFAALTSVEFLRFKKNNISFIGEMAFPSGSFIDLSHNNIKVLPHYLPAGNQFGKKFIKTHGCG